MFDPINLYQKVNIWLGPTLLSILRPPFKLYHAGVGILVKTVTFHFGDLSSNPVDAINFLNCLSKDLFLSSFLIGKGNNFIFTRDWLEAPERTSNLTFCVTNYSIIMKLICKIRIWWAVVVVVKWSACSPSTPTIRVQIARKPTVFM